MSLLALGTPVNYVGDQGAFSGIIEPAAETSLGANTGLTFVNAPEGLVLLRVVVGASGAATLTLVGQDGNPNKTKSVANSTMYWFGPFDPALYSNQAGLVQVNFSVVTGNSAGVYIMAAGAPVPSARGLHNPFQQIPGAPDR